MRSLGFGFQGSASGFGLEGSGKVSRASAFEFRGCLSLSGRAEV